MNVWDWIELAEIVWLIVLTVLVAILPGVQSSVSCCSDYTRERVGELDLSVGRLTKRLRDLEHPKCKCKSCSAAENTRRGEGR